MKERIVASILAIFVGGLGIHRFYLGQIGRGILCILTFPISTIVAPIIGIIWLLSSEESFNQKYNAQRIQLEQLKTMKDAVDSLKNKNK